MAAQRRQAAHGRAVRADGDDDGARRPDPVDGRAHLPALGVVVASAVVVCIVVHQPRRRARILARVFEAADLHECTALERPRRRALDRHVPDDLRLRQQVAEASEIGQYTLEEKIGSGGMGEVWRARHRMLIRPAAVKLVRRACARLGARTRPGAAGCAASSARRARPRG